ncbi:MAG: hypothetical protein HWN66_16225 [Candidatus Helarchaeota archaeon]|nr:hypothetical protein [Candidatus Helarchaeota archaeon]
MKLWRILKPSIKGSIMVVIGVLNTAIGIGRATINLIYGPIAFFFLAISGLFVIEIVQTLEESSQNSSITVKPAKIFRGMFVFGVMYIIGSTIAVYNLVINDLDFFIIYFVAAVGILWLSLGLYAVQGRKNVLIENIVVSLAFTIGLLYGGVLNSPIIPIFIYFFFLTAFFLQLSRELVRGFNDGEGEEDESPSEITDDDQKILKFSLIFQLFAIIFFVLPIIYVNVSISFLFIYPMIIGLIFISIACYLTFKSVLEKKCFTKISSLLKIGVVIEIIAFILAIYN